MTPSSKVIPTAVAPGISCSGIKTDRFFNNFTYIFVFIAQK
jgi:hypothetical protein